VLVKTHPDVMNERGIIRQELHRRDQGVFLEWTGNSDIGPLDHTFGRHRERRQVDDDVRLNEPSGLSEFHRGRGIPGIALWRAAVGPFHDRVDVGLGHRSIVTEAHRMFGIGKPRRHRLGDNCPLDGLGPGTYLFVGEERHRRDLVRPMAHLAMPLEDRLDISMKRGGSLSVRWRGAHERKNCAQQIRHAMHLATPS